MMDEKSSRGLEGRAFTLVGGFLGAGKTTLISLFSNWLQVSGKRVAVVTNDQGVGLIDSQTVLKGGRGGSPRLPTDHLVAQSVGEPPTPPLTPLSPSHAEITGGCFCCRLDELVDAIGRLDSESRPDVIIAEPVGSCTDLMATVVRPLEQVYDVPFALSPLSVVLDARRALAALGGKRSKRDFHKDVGYIYRKQIEEAEWLVVNKADLLAEEDLADLLLRLEKDYPGKRIFVVSAKTGEGLEEWFTALSAARTGGGQAMEVDYARYAEGEALLGWVNSEAECVAKGEVDWEAWLKGVGERIAGLLDEGGHEVGHFKMSVDDGEAIYRVHQVMGGDGVESTKGGRGGSPRLPSDQLVSQSVGEPPTPPLLLVNLRAEGDATVLESLVMLAFSEQEEVTVTFQHQAAFQPGKPVPVHRIG